MNTSPASRLSALRGADLRELHEAGRAPDPAELDGVIDGVVLNGRLSLPVVRGLRLWRGKVFSRDETGAVSGLNRLGFGPLETRRYRFTARLAPSLFGDREVVFLGHDQPSNPAAVRRFHDELVAVDNGLYLATSHYRSGDELRYLCHFALALPGRRPGT